MPDFLEEDLLPTQCFERFFNDDVIKLLVNDTERYVRNDKGDHLFSTSFEEMKAFIGILIISGYNDLPRQKLY